MNTMGTRSQGGSWLRKWFGGNDPGDAEALPAASTKTMTLCSRKASSSVGRLRMCLSRASTIQASRPATASHSSSGASGANRW